MADSIEFNRFVGSLPISHLPNATFEIHTVRFVRFSQTEIEKGFPTGRQFGETMGNSLLLYLVQQDSTAIPHLDQNDVGLAGLRLKRVLDCVDAKRGSDTHLAELAEGAATRIHPDRGKDGRRLHRW